MFHTLLYFCPGVSWKISQIVLLNCIKSFCQYITDLIEALPKHLASKGGCAGKTSKTLKIRCLKTEKRICESIETRGSRQKTKPRALPQAFPMSCVATQFLHNTKARRAVTAEPLH